MKDLALNPEALDPSASPQDDGVATPPARVILNVVKDLALSPETLDPSASPQDRVASPLDNVLSFSVSPLGSRLVFSNSFNKIAQLAAEILNI